MPSKYKPHTIYNYIRNKKGKNKDIQDTPK